MKASQLRASILQQAVEGKLVPQIPEEGTAADLLESIRAEREALIKAGKIKKAKPLPKITEDEIPFEIPESWEWVRLGDIGDTNIGLTYSPENVVPYGKGTVVLRSGNIQGGKLDYADLVSVNLPIPPEKYCEVGDILICARNGSHKLVGKSAIIDKEGMSFGAFMALYRSPCNNYVNLVISSPLFRKTFSNEVGTSTINQITQNMLKTFAIPLPPLAEQKRIVAKLEELMPLIDAYEKEEEKLSALEKSLPEKLRRSVLQQAVEGKLVPQIAEEGTAAELLKEIEKERAGLIKAGKMKKAKPLPEITEEEIPFEIPESWEWVRLGDITYNFGQKVPDKEFTYIDVASINNHFGILKDDLSILPPNQAPVRARKIVQNGCVIYSTVRPYLLNICVIDKTFEAEPIVSTAFAVLNPVKVVYNKYLFYYLRSLTFVEYVNDKSSGMAYPAIAEKELYKGLIPLPPLAEQKRIVAKLEELMQIIDKL